MAKAKKEAPVLGDNTTPERLVDEFGSWNEQRKEAEQQENFYKTALKARIEDGQNASFEGEEFICFVTQESRGTFDYEAFLKDKGIEITPDDRAKFAKVSHFPKMVVKRK